MANKKLTIGIICVMSCFLLCIGVQYESNAQSGSSVWNDLKTSTRTTKTKAQRLGKKAGQLKSHLEKWGLDSNYNHGLSIGGRLNSNGWSGLVSYQKRINRRQSSIYQLSVSEIKHEKEIKQQRQNTVYPELGSSTPFIFGKVNNVYSLQLGYGREYLLLPGILEGNIAVGFTVQGGFSLAMLKPYYLRLLYVTDTPTKKAWVQEEKYNGANADKFLNTGYILGKSKWKQGLNETIFIPGIYLDGAIAIKFAKSKTFIKAVALGFNFLVHTRNIEMMADQKSNMWNAAIYAQLSIGKHWR
jgi:hypothetical protein